MQAIIDILNTKNPIFRIIIIDDFSIIAIMNAPIMDKPIPQPAIIKDTR